MLDPDEVFLRRMQRRHPGYLGSQDTFYVGTLKGVGRIYQQTFIDTYSKIAFAKLYTTKTPITAADHLNDRVLPFFEAQELPMLRILTDRGTEYCGELTSMTISFIWPLMTLIIRKQRPCHRKPMGFVSDSIKLFYRSFIR